MVYIVGRIGVFIGWLCNFDPRDTLRGLILRNIVRKYVVFILAVCILSKETRPNIVRVSFGVYSIVLKTLMFFDVFHIYLANLLADVGIFITEDTNIVEPTYTACHINTPLVSASLLG